MERKNVSIILAQKDILTQFIKEHPDLQTGRFSKDFTFKKAQSLWEEVTVILNSVPNGAQKDWRQWRKTWQDLKKHVKSKAVAAKKHISGTGGGEPVKQLSEVDAEILQIISPTQIEGINSMEAPLYFTFNKENEIEDSLELSKEIVLDNGQPSTSKINDHDYINLKGVQTPKKMNKTTRLKSR